MSKKFIFLLALMSACLLIVGCNSTTAIAVGIGGKAILTATDSSPTVQYCNTDYPMIFAQNGPADFKIQPLTHTDMCALSEEGQRSITIGTVITYHNTEYTYAEMAAINDEPGRLVTTEKDGYEKICNYPINSVEGKTVLAVNNIVVG